MVLYVGGQQKKCQSDKEKRMTKYFPPYSKLMELKHEI